MTAMKQLLKSAFIVFLMLTVLTGVMYPLAITGVARMLFSHRANGSLLVKDGREIGSEFIGQPFDDPRYFWSRLSATGPFPYNASASSGSNYGPLNPALKQAVEARIKALRAADPGNDAPVPVDLVTASASGLDPHITVAAAQYQAIRVARQRGWPEAQVEQLVAQFTEGQQWGMLGERRVNVLKRKNVDLSQVR
ncbi:MAG: kdpC [Dehalococcoidia bacterium]|nr:kdpC [Dehalococcoidia bacterium]